MTARVVPFGTGLDLVKPSAFDQWHLQRETGDLVPLGALDLPAARERALALTEQPSAAVRVELTAGPGRALGGHRRFTRAHLEAS